MKSIFRHTLLFDGSRHENDAEHAWHIAMMAIVFSEYAAQPVDLGKVLKMLLIHDIVEIDSGDFLVYDPRKEEKKEKEKAGANRIFGLLPDVQAKELYNLWEEFENKTSPEAKYAAALDRLEPIIQNYINKGFAWKKNKITADMVKSVNRHIEEGAPKLWAYATEIIDDAIKKGYFNHSDVDSE